MNLLVSIIENLFIHQSVSSKKSEHWLWKMRTENWILIGREEHQIYKPIRKFTAWKSTFRNNGFFDWRNSSYLRWSFQQSIWCDQNQTTIGRWIKKTCETHETTVWFSMASHKNDREIRRNGWSTERYQKFFTHICKCNF